MKALILIGSKTDDSESVKIHDIILEELKKLNWDATSISLEDKDIAYCLGCFGCWVQTPGECVIKDYEETIVRKMVNTDLIIYINIHYSNSFWGVLVNSEEGIGSSNLSSFTLFYEN